MEAGLGGGREHEFRLPRAVKVLLPVIALVVLVYVGVIGGLPQGSSSIEGGEDSTFNVRNVASDVVAKNDSVSGSIFDANVSRGEVAGSLFQIAKSHGLVEDSWRPTTSLQRSAFTDVDESTPYAREIQWLASAGVAGGSEVEGGFEFRPDEDVMRCDMASFLFRLAKLDGRAGASGDWVAPEEVKARFLDVDAETRHAKSVWWVALAVISEGWEVNGGYEFRPYACVTRSEMDEMLRRFEALR